MKKFKSIEFFPDFSSSGIWITDEGKQDRYHVNIDPEQLNEYGINLSDNLKKKIKIMNEAYDYFLDTKDSDFDFMIKSIEKDFIKEFPQYKNKLLTSCK